MPHRVTQHDIIESIIELRNVARDLRSAAGKPPVDGISPPVVLVQVVGLLAHAQYLETVAEELLALIPDRQVPKVPG